MLLTRHIARFPMHMTCKDIHQIFQDQGLNVEQIALTEHIQKNESFKIAQIYIIIYP